MSSMDPVGLRFKPPVSKVIPLPTKAISLLGLSGSPRYLKIINRGGTEEP